MDFLIKLQNIFLGLVSKEQEKVMLPLYIIGILYYT